MGKLDKYGLKERKKLLEIGMIPKNDSELSIVNAFAQLKADTKQKYKK